ncbi:hypothetical protein BDV25DRAFT_136128 [Aspergillus avenaceus]|uniref:Uncharacterized protein n=1 Tax=Aspergillus avenaceus TaxID=36643 RepID=A0A5N6U6I1_ASPAV|nr:hypothetical protein BDV25DRAFT_136128 [Aspergillus avenaceus]
MKFLVLVSALVGMVSAAAIAQPELVERACNPIYGDCKVDGDCCGSLTCFTHAAGGGNCADL